MSKTIRELVIEYFSNHSNQELEHGPVVDWVTSQWILEHNLPPRDPWRMIRALHQEGFLIKVKKGVYLYDPQAIISKDLENFSTDQKEFIFSRDNYRCVICGRGRQDGIEIHADHIIPKDKGGKADISNGQTLCSEHNFRKKNYNQTEMGKKMFIRLYELAKDMKDRQLINFCDEILKVFESNNIDNHIKWNR